MVALSMCKQANSKLARAKIPALMNTLALGPAALSGSKCCA